ncbi:Nicotinamide nucleotide repair protein [Candidatus Ornithobacterium hominis]|uniref:Bifunctional NAD(P)H-hydrate repair enzyme n=1 Tax=Candidatus Ornithobacterium hominis TaxID=2497989 RepID=A0A383TZG7_9FLAO|nr:NAD(P)H-hydrate dehydratase [Candidatus Ornithobacterium hominis]MCT7904076.1 NAD(P)H-hydrate dehydratase [Candidatus Ornithobacterium hominis]SZD72386.1 Nicotinamide nucleotide repair protein [Candidatus Ornithobacterium hominis]
MKIISANQIRALDKVTMKNKNISSIELMEHAGQKLYTEIYKKHAAAKTFAICCGNGNNGGDGLVLARLLHQQGCKVIIFCSSRKEKKSDENLKNFLRLEKLGVPILRFEEIKPIKDVIWVDALFGTGLNQSLAGKWREIVNKINNLEGKKIAIDVPSGLMADKIGATEDVVFQADETLTIGQPKLTFFFHETGKYVGDFKIIDIGLDENYLNFLPSDFYFSSTKEIKKIYSPRERFSHKGTYGHALIIAGSYGKIGAAVLSTQAALRAGAGLVSNFTPRCGYDILQISAPEAMTLTDVNQNFLTQFPAVENFKSIGVGPGLGQEKTTQRAFFGWLEQTNFEKKNLILDADALNFLSLKKNYLKFLPSNSILTPHPKEFERLAGKTTNSLERINLAREFAQELNIILVLKDAYTAVISPSGEVFFNSTGNSALSTGGSGDVLTGIITGLCAQGYSTLVASKLGVWLHGKTPTLARSKASEESFTASTILAYLGLAFNQLNSKD